MLPENENDYFRQIFYRFLLMSFFLNIRKFIYFNTLYCRYLVFLFVVFGIQDVASQNVSDTVNIKEIVVFETKINDLTGYKIIKIDSSVLSNSISQSLDEILSKNSSINIKNYGNGSVSSSSFRGSGASHTKVLWNGVKINSAMLGQIDFSQIPAFFVDEVSIYQGGAAIGNNSGALGATVNLSSLPNWKNQTSFNFAHVFGSFNTNSSFGSFAIGNKKFQSKTKILHTSSDNDFEYKVPPFNENETILKQKNANFLQSALIQEFYLKPNSKTLISSAIWLQKSNRSIPSGENVSQKDEFVRSYIEMKRFFNNSNICFRSSYIYDYLNYSDKILFIDSRNSSENFSNFVEYKLDFSQKLKFHAGISNSFYKTNSTNFDKKFERQIYSVFSGLNFELKERQNFSLLLKQEMIDKEYIPIIFSFGYQLKILKNSDLYLKANLSKNYHAPTLNDLYWSELGNPDLKNEEAYSGEFGFQFMKKNNQSMYFETELTAYSSLIDNWIIWVPQSSFIWKPENLKQVYRRGIEANIKTVYNFGQLKINLNSFYIFCKSTNIKTNFANDNSLNKQLIYVPYHSLGTNFMIKHKNSFIKYSYNFAGKRFAQSDNSESIEYMDFLPPYNLSNASIGYEIKRNNSVFTFQFEVKNLWNKNYQLVLNYPMPLRNFSITIRYRFLKT